MTHSLDPQNDAEFDAHAERYREMHEASLSLSGEPPEYFAEYKANVLRMILALDDRPILDFGCGIGNLTKLLGGGGREVHGYDPSVRSVDLAASRAPSATFYDDLAAIPEGRFGTIVMANVLHHVERSERAELVASLVPLLQVGGRVVVFEHNRRNPATVRAVRKCEFDEGVTLLTRGEIADLLQRGGLDQLRSRFVVFFPRPLRALRPLEPRLGRIPLGAQVCVWASRPG